MKGRNRKILLMAGLSLSFILLCESVYASYIVNDEANPFGVRIALRDAYSLMVDGSEYGEMNEKENGDYSIAYSQNEVKTDKTTFAVKSGAGTLKKVSASIYFKGTYSLLYSSSDASLSITYSLYFTDNQNWGNPYAYVWSTEAKNAAWPGVKMTYAKTNDYGQKQYKVIIDATKFGDESTNIIFSNGNGSQTVDIALKDQNISASETGFYPSSESSGKWNVGTFTYS